jgi:hypothetical protein
LTAAQITVPAPDSPTSPNSVSTVSEVTAAKATTSADPSGTGSIADGLADLYKNLNDNFFRSIPAPLRVLVLDRIQNVSSAHELTGAASMALVLLQLAQARENTDQPARAELLQQSDNFFQEAVRALDIESIPLEAQMIAVMDLHVYQLSQAGAAAAYAILLVGNYFLTQALGDRPALDLTQHNQGCFILGMYAHIDVLHAVATGGRRTLFDLTLPVPHGEGEPITTYGTHMG